MTFDDETLAQLENLLERMTIPELLRFCEGSLKAATHAQAVLFRRDEGAWVRFNQSIELGTIDLGRLRR